LQQLRWTQQAIADVANLGARAAGNESLTVVSPASSISSGPHGSMEMHTAREDLQNNDAITQPNT